MKFFNERLGFYIENRTSVNITREDAVELLSRCEKVLQNHNLAEELLPTTPGLFFGGVEYDDYYFENVKTVKNYIKNILLKQFDNLDYNEEIEFQIDY